MRSQSVVTLKWELSERIAHNSKTHSSNYSLEVYFLFLWPEFRSGTNLQNVRELRIFVKTVKSLSELGLMQWEQYALKKKTFLLKLFPKIPNNLLKLQKLTYFQVHPRRINALYEIPVFAIANPFFFQLFCCTGKRPTNFVKPFPIHI